MTVLQLQHAWIESVPLPYNLLHYTSQTSDKQSMYADGSSRFAQVPDETVST